MSDHDDAARYAAAAGELLLDLRAQADDDDWARWSLGDSGDLLANRHLLELLHEEHPDDRILSEESADDPRRLDADRVWIVDPLDGTREFTEIGRSDWAVHVALWERGHGISAAAVALPALGVVLSTGTPPVVPASDGRRPRIVVSRSRAPAAARRVAEALDGDLVYLGSAGAKTMAVVLGEVDAYVHAGGQYEWDSAAPTASPPPRVSTRRASTASPLEYNRPDPWLPDLIVCRPELATDIVAAAAPY